MLNRKPLLVFVTIMLFAFAGILMAQDSSPLPDTPDCNPATLAEQQATFESLLTFDFEADAETARDNLFRLGAAYQMLALQCGYEATDVEVDAMIQQILVFASMADIITANSVGGDMDAILLGLDDVRGDLFNGQLLYNSIENGLDGFPLGCSGCHGGEAAPLTEGTWTRTDEIRLNDEALAGYDVQRYLVESIIHPNTYTVPDYLPNLMPSNFGSRLDMQMLADIVAYLESQDQLLEE
ncbi:MAG: hypothetical protein Q9P01_06510 [Anaerolineae bacterium]|nr:hypothetical protein [Anaerolineae bacterium]MDQ7034484.1 hypothetical protein [Anaerolineae bacterium]